MFRKVIKFLKEVRMEMGRVIWPTRDELKGSTIVVIVMTLALTAFIFIVDRIFTQLFELFFGK